MSSNCHSPDPMWGTTILCPRELLSRGPDCDLCNDSETQDCSSGHSFSFSCASKTSFTTMPSLDVRDLKEVERFRVSVFDSLFTQTFFSV